MHENRKTEFLAALRSGEYRKTEGMLYSPSPSGKDSYCALGVLCVLAMKDGVPVEFDPEDPDCYFFTYPRDSKTYRAGHFVPSVVAEWAGLEGDEEFIIMRTNDRIDRNNFRPVALRLEDVL